MVGLGYLTMVVSCGECNLNHYFMSDEVVEFTAYLYYNQRYCKPCSTANKYGKIILVSVEYSK